jgi:hypothetical protein
LLNVMDWTALVVFTSSLPKLKLVGEKVALGPESPPTPVKENACEPIKASSVIMIEALRGPNWLGVKVTFRVQLAAAPRLEPHVLLCSKSVALAPAVATPLITSSEPPLLVSVSTCELLVAPTTTTPKLKLAGAITRAGGVGGADDPQPPSRHVPQNISAKCFFMLASILAGLGSEEPAQSTYATGKAGVWLSTQLYSQNAFCQEKWRQVLLNALEL